MRRLELKPQSYQKIFKKEGKERKEKQGRYQKR
jgi:hypothetical protein